MNVIRDRASAGSANRPALVMLPGAGGRAQDFVDRGFVDALRVRATDIDVIAVDAGFDPYLEQNIAERLEREIVAPLRRDGATRIWLMGISLGGLGALSYASRHPGVVEGAVLLAPFVGTRGLVAEVTRAGGLAQWQPGSIAVGDGERLLLSWLRGYHAADPALPQIWLGYGAADRYAPASRLLAARLPADQVLAIDGGHDWPTWRNLWEGLLDRGMLASLSEKERP